MKITAVLLALVLTLLLSACGGSAGVAVGHSDNQGNYVEARATVVWRAADATESGIDMESINPADIYVTIDTINTQLSSSSGVFTATLYDSSSNVIAAQQFSFYRSGNKLLPSNPSSVASWANAYPQAEGVGVVVNHLNYQDASSGDATIRAAIVSSNTEVASASTTFPAHGGNGGHGGNVCSIHACVIK